jgi:sec-independent protein translocase protein TatA
MSQLIMINFLGMPGGTELIIITLIVLLLFGGKKIPELMKGLGKGIREFNNAKANIQNEINEGMKEIDEPKQEEIKKSSSKVEIVEGEEGKADKA